MQEQENTQQNVEEYEQLFREFKENKDLLMQGIETLEKLRKTKLPPPPSNNM